MMDTLFFNSYNLTDSLTLNFNFLDHIFFQLSKMPGIFFIIKVNH